MNTRCHLSIIIANWNTRDLLHHALESIERHPPSAEFEVLVVDNNSNDGSVEMITQQHPDVRLLKSSRNDGYARANNMGAASSRGNVLLLLGSDVVVIDESIQKMLDRLDAETDLGAVSCRLLNPDRTVQQSCRRFPTLRDGVMTYLSLHALAPSYNLQAFDYYRTQDVDQPAATCFMIRKSLVDQIGLFDERYAVLYNDVDLCKRIRDAGLRILYYAEAEIIHHGSQSTRQAGPELRLEMYRNILLYYTTNCGIMARWILTPILVIRLLAVTRSLIAFQLFRT
jgi:GT2 family glycosyltransferase